jgi:hypothetical protein
MTFVANDTVSAALMHRTIMPALQNAFSVEARGVPRMEAAGGPTECTLVGTYPGVMSQLPEAHHHARERTLLR